MRTLQSEYKAGIDDMCTITNFAAVSMHVGLKFSWWWRFIHWSYRFICYVIFEVLTIISEKPTSSIFKVEEWQVNTANITRHINPDQHTNYTCAATINSHM